MASNPAALLLLLVLAVICAIVTAHTAAGERADRLTTNARARVRGVGGAADVMSARSLRIESTVGSRNGSTRVGVGVGIGSGGGAVEASVAVGTQITVSGVSLNVSFDALRCFSFPKAALRALKAGRDVQVWWNGLAGGNKGRSSKGGSKGGGGSREKEAGTDGQAGAACKQLKFFANPACKGKALDEVLKPQNAGLRRFFNVPRWVVGPRGSLGHVGHGGTWVMGARGSWGHVGQSHVDGRSTKTVSRWTSVSCKSDITCQHATCPSNSTCMPTSDSKGVTCACNPGFAARNGTCHDNCDAVKCGPGGNCERDANGDPSCSCSAGFTSSSDKLSCIDNCDAVKCGPGGNCTRDASGDPSCSCSAGFTPSSDMLSCIDNCDGVKCGPGGNCTRDAEGNPFCSCNTGFKQSSDKLSCI
ncbi:unnamed protein product, partial [Closterium sp. NIES-64]